MHDTRKATRSTPAPQDTARTSPAPLPGTWRTRPGVPTLAERAAIRDRLRGTARPRPQPRPQPRRQAEVDPFAAWLASGLPSTELHRFCGPDYYADVNRRSPAQRAAARGLVALPKSVRFEATADEYRRARGLPTVPHDVAMHARCAAEWARRDALTPAAGRAG